MTIMPKKSQKKYPVWAWIFIIAFIILAVTSLVIIYTNDNLVEPRHVINYFIEEKTGIDLEELLNGPSPFAEDEQISETENSDNIAEADNANQDNNAKAEQTEEPKKTSNKKTVSKNIQGLEIPSCPKGSLLITEQNSKGVLDTPEKEDSHQIIKHNGFILCYREKYEQPEWVCYTLDAKKVVKNVDRNDNFRPDPLVITGSAELSDYRSSGYDRGHLAPSADLTYSAETMDESFVLSNMSPQRGQFNRGMWKDLEHEVRTLTSHYELLYVVTGPILEKDDYSTIGKNKVAVPDYYYKALLGIKDNKYFMIGFILPNENCEGTIWDYACSVDEVEKRTGLDFFHLLDASTESELEKTCIITDWKY